MRKATRRHLLYYISFGNPPDLARAVYSDGTTRDWRPGDRGFKAAVAKSRRGR